MNNKLLALVSALWLLACQANLVDHKQATLIDGQPGGPAAVGLIVELGGVVPVLRCTGTLIADDAVLTAAHCILDDLPQTLGFVASHDLARVNLAEIIPARELHPHSLFIGVDAAPVGVAQANDIGVLLLGSASSTPPLPIAGSGLLLMKNDTLTLVGAGWTFAGGSANGEMHQGDATLTEVGNFEFGAGLVGEAQACLGDSGGAVLAQEQLVGTISRTNDPLVPCEGGSVSTLIHSYLDFIALHVTLPCGSGDQPACQTADAANTTFDASTATDASVIGPGGGGGSIVPRDDDGGCRLSGSASSTPTSGAPLCWLLLLGLVLRRKHQKRES
ncbi:MAG: trypsin-like serine protease [Deltaproteobacteria bacterium]|nr:trypsin-like serine protease [Deltaproteobacteria bacterium]